MARKKKKKNSEMPSKVFDAFKVYRDLGPGRTMKKAMEIIKGRQKGRRGVGLASIEKWSTQYDWQRRISEWEYEQDQVFKLEQKKAIKDMVRRHANASLMFQKKAIDKIQEVIHSDLTPKEALDFFKEAVRIERLSRGEPDNMTELTGNTGAISFKDFASVYEKIKKEKK